MNDIKDVASGKATLTKGQVQLLCLLFLRATSLLLWIIGGKEPNQDSAALEWAADVKRIVDSGKLKGIPEEEDDGTDY